MRRALPLLLLAGCVGAHRVPVRTVEAYDGPLYADGEVVQVRLGGPEASEPFASLGWIPAQVGRMTLGGLPAPSGTARGSINLLDAATITWGAGGNDLIRSTAGFVEIPNLYVTNAFTVPVMIDFGGAGAGLTNSGTSAPVLSNDVDGTCIGNGTGTNCDGVASAASYAFYNCAGCTITSDGSSVQVGSDVVASGHVVYAGGIAPSGSYYAYNTDDTANTGNRTINKACGKSAIAATATAATITNSVVTASTAIILGSFLDTDATCTRMKFVASGTGFVATCNAAATATTKFQWCVLNKGD